MLNRYYACCPTLAVASRGITVSVICGIIKLYNKIYDMLI